MATVLDYAFYPHPGPVAVKAAGASFVMRYISSWAGNDTSGKNLLPGELAGLLAAGIGVGVVVEEVAGTGGGWMLGGYGAGVAAAQHADAVVTALSMPGIPVYFAADFDVTPAQQATVNLCLDGAASVTGRDRTGIYGGYWAVSRALDAGKASRAWQTYAWSSWYGGTVPAQAVVVSTVAGRGLGRECLFDTRAALRQGVSASIGGASCDLNEAVAADFGQWPRPAIPQPSPQEDDMPSGTIPSDEATWAACWPAGTCSFIAFFGGPPLPGMGAQQLTVNVHSRANGYSQTVNVDAAGQKTVVSFTEKDVDAVGIARKGTPASWTPVAFNAG